MNYFECSKYYGIMTTELEETKKYWKKCNEMIKLRYLKKYESPKKKKDKNTEKRPSESIFILLV